MNNEQTSQIIKAMGDLGFTVVELKQELFDGSAGVVKSNGRGTTGTIVIRMVPMESND